MGTKGKKNQTDKIFACTGENNLREAFSQRKFVVRESVQGVIVCQLGVETQRKYSLSAAHCWIRDLSQQYQILKLYNGDKTNYQNTRKRGYIPEATFSFRVMC